MTRIAIVGGGISGLATAFFLRQQLPAAEIRVFEAGSRAGGKIFTEVVEGPRGSRFWIEHGPNGFLDNAPVTLELARAAGLGEELLRSSDAARRRYIFLRGRLRRVPESPPAFLRSDLLSWRGKLRAAREWFVKRGDAALVSAETVAEFARRRLGAEVLHAMVEPFVNGVFAVDPESLEVSTAFPRLVALEQEHGGLLRALVHAERAKRAAERAGTVKPLTAITSLREGMGALPSALARSLGPAVHVNSAVRSLTRDGIVWRLSVEVAGRADSWDCDSVVLALPSLAGAELVKPFALDIGRALSGIDSVPIAVVALGFEQTPGTGPPVDGFGFLVARGESLRALGVLAESNIWPRGQGGVLVRVLYGGSADRGALDLDDRALVAQARQDLRQATGFSAEPIVERVIRWRSAIPQYARGHGARVAALDTALANHPGLFLAGASYRGVAVNDLCRGAKSLADGIAAAANRRGA